LTKRAIRIAQSKALSPDTDEPAPLSRDDRQGEALPIVFSLDAGQDRENITKTFAMPHESSPRVSSLDTDEGNKIKDQDLEISGLKARVKSLEDKESRRAAVSTASVSPATACVPTVSESFPTPMRIPVISAKDKGKEKVTETEVPKKKKLQEQIDTQVAGEIEKEFSR
nr:hypothetical protein [Tanacetum cinerariifolium]